MKKHENKGALPYRRVRMFESPVDGILIHASIIQPTIELHKGKGASAVLVLCIAMESHVERLHIHFSPEK